MMIMIYMMNKYLIKIIRKIGMSVLLFSNLKELLDKVILKIN